MTHELIVMCGVPGSGKSTIAAKQCSWLNFEGVSATVISRDAVRFSMLNDEEDYFAHEDEAWEEFITQINTALEVGIEYVFVDATHLSPGSRKKILSRIIHDDSTYLTFEIVAPSLETCLKRNAIREGRACVPEDTIKSMHRGFIIPTPEEFIKNDFGFKTIKFNYHTNEDIM